MIANFKDTLNCRASAADDDSDHSTCCLHEASVSLFAGARSIRVMMHRAVWQALHLSALCEWYC